MFLHLSVILFTRGGGVCLCLPLGLGGRALSFLGIAISAPVEVY